MSDLLTKISHYIRPSNKKQNTDLEQLLRVYGHVAVYEEVALTKVPFP
jgi:hypothetical protein